MKYRYLVEVELPPGVTPEEFQEYIKDEVSAGVGARHPSEPIFHLDKTSVLVSPGEEVS